jgi:hypothetical protein
VFDDPQTVLGMAIGLLVIIGGTLLGVRGHLRKERQEAGDRSRPR